MMIQSLASSKGNQFSYETSTPGGFYWGDHLRDSTTIPKIRTSNYDYLVLQEQSLAMATNKNGYAKHRHGSFSSADFLNHYSQIVDSCRKTMLYLTWGRKDGDGIYQSASDYGQNFQEMQNYLTENYLQLADLIGAEVAPAGEAWREVITNYPQINLFAADGSHPSLAGTYLSACVFYTSLFHESAAGGWIPSGLASSTAQQLQAVADQLVVGAWANWNIDVQPAICTSSGLKNNIHQWESTFSGNTQNLTEIEFTSTQHGFVKGYGTRVWQTLDAGDQWVPVQLPAKSALGGYDPNSYDITFLSKDTAWFVVNDDVIDSATLLAPPFGTTTADFRSFLRFYRSTDGGASWQERSPVRQDYEILNSGALATRPTFTNMHLYFEDALKGTLLCNYGYLKDTVMYSFWTNDGGLTWGQNQDTLAGAVTDKLWYKNATEAYKSGYKNHLHLNSDPQLIYKTTDRGATWVETASLNNNCCEVPYSSVGHSFSALHLVGQDTLIAVNSFSNPTVYRSTDACITWDSVANLQYIGTVQDLIQPLDGVYYLIISSKLSRVLVSHDYGATWELEAYFPKGLNQMALTEKYVYVVGDKGGIYRRATPLFNAVDKVENPVPPLELFPNPTTGSVQLRGTAPNVEVVVRSTLGVQVKQTTTDAFGEANLELSELPGGMYLICVKYPGELVTRKLILEP